MISLTLGKSFFSPLFMFLIGKKVPYQPTLPYPLPKPHIDRIRVSYLSTEMILIVSSEHLKKVSSQHLPDLKIFSRKKIGK